MPDPFDQQTKNNIMHLQWQHGSWVIEFTQLKFKTLKSNVHEALRNRGGRF